ncbi:hemolysin family protein [Natronomonas gomsonensis]|jgi:putative hemolysin|uniref:hemolysin family protein n=1 Tax=Natronomonas gomsonensis TaxID=1046043 RepID=UPI0020CA323D|nr:hemolysin family protein [Natronomonas gomsonensis]MCY4731669.1 hemolysin family protein [Natronomonas gomsonensis]
MGSLALSAVTVWLQAAPDAGELPFSDTTVIVLGGVVILGLVALSGFFSSSEIAMFSLPPHRVDALVSDEIPGAETLKHLKDDPHRLLVTILVGNNIVNIAMSSIATGLLATYFLSQGQAVLASTFGITALVLLFGESAPKSYAVEHTESWALRIARPLQYAEYVLMPLVITFDYLTRQVNRLTGGQSSIESTYVTREEIRDIIETGERAGVLEEDEREMLQRIFRFTNTIAKEIMTPRLDMDAVSKDASIEEALEKCVHANHTRLPVYEGSLDNVLGIVHVSDLVRDYSYGEREDVELEDLIQETLHVPESKNVDELLAEMRESRMHMVIVIDEFGTTEGLVTMEDITEEIVGELLEAGEEEPIEFIDDRTAVIKGEVNIDEVNEALEIDIPEGEEFETLAGFIFNRAGRLVEEGETIEYDGIDIHIEGVENTRIMKARLVRTEAYDEQAPEEQIADEE